MAATPPPQPSTQESVKETLISIVIAFAMAFVFRGFVIEAFVIPTGSMAPTLLGAHMRFHGPQSGASWAVGPWFAIPPGTDNYLRPQLDPDRRRDIAVHDPVTGQLQGGTVQNLQSGDRILVLKYIYALREPRRFDVIVFKNPTNPAQNYIKRLIGLPGEDIALVDGDVFVRTGGTPEGQGPLPLWEQSGWTVARKPALVQDAVWQTVFDSASIPIDPAVGFVGPWTPANPGAWSLTGRRFELRPDAIAGELIFDQSRPRFTDPNSAAQGRSESWTVDDRYAYNEFPSPVGGMFNHLLRFPVSDVRVRAGFQHFGSVGEVVFSLRARGHDFEGVITETSMEIRRRELVGSAGVAGRWETLASRPLGSFLGTFPAGAIVDVSFAHADQRLTLTVGREILTVDYDWTPAQRIYQATGRPLEDLLESQGRSGGNPLADGRIYSRPEIRVRIGGSRATLHRLALDRDLSYQPTAYGGGRGDPALATSPDSPLALGPDQFFACGDNSPASLDGRLWETVDHWVAQEYDERVGIIPRDLLLGKAFFVYWPSLLYGRGPVPVPDFGRMRFIH
jgi:signal peptidase I